MQNSDQNKGSLILHCFICFTGVFLWTSRLFWWYSDWVRRVLNCVFVQRTSCMSCVDVDTCCILAHSWTYSSSSSPAPTCTAPLGSLSYWMVSCPSLGPPTTKCCSSVKWPHLWPSWRTTLRTATSSTCVWMVRDTWSRLTFGLLTSIAILQETL